MFITVSHSDEAIQEFEINTFPIIVGRGGDADVVISSEHISRKHLEIQNRDGQIFIRDLTLSNWVSYNDEKLSKSEYIQYFDFAPLVLPSGHEINFQTSAAEGLKMQEEDMSGSRDIDILSKKKSAVNKAAKGKVRHTQVKKDSKSQQFLIVMLLIGVVGYIAFNFLENRQPSEKSRGDITIYRSEKNVPLAVDLSLLDKMLIGDKCLSTTIKPLCDSLLPNLRASEGVVEYKKTLFVFKDYDSRLSSLFNDKQKLEQTKVSPEDLKKVIAAQKVVVSNFLRALKKRSVAKIYIVLFQNTGEVKSIANTYVVDTSLHLKTTQEDYKKSYIAMIKNNDVSVFNEKMSLLINEKTDIK